MTKEQAEQILKNIIDNLKLTRQEYDLLLKALETLKQ
jgi:hypothetical protein